MYFILLPGAQQGSFLVAMALCSPSHVSPPRVQAADRAGCYTCPPGGRKREAPGRGHSHAHPVPAKVGSHGLPGGAHGHGHHGGHPGAHHGPTHGQHYGHYYGWPGPGHHQLTGANKG